MESTSLIDTLFQTDFIRYIAIGVLGYVALFWIALIIWVTKDITNRTNNLLYQILSIFLIIFLTPLFGLVIYLIIRPSRTLIEKFYEEAEFTMLKKDEQDFMHEHCPHCQTKVHKEFNYCTGCGQKVKKICTSCARDIMINWSSCPFCGTKQIDETTEDKKKAAKKTTQKSKTKESVAKAKQEDTSPLDDSK